MTYKENRGNKERYLARYVCVIRQGKIAAGEGDTAATAVFKEALACGLHKTKASLISFMHTHAIEVSKRAKLGGIQKRITNQHLKDKRGGGGGGGRQDSGKN